MSNTPQASAVQPDDTQDEAAQTRPAVPLQTVEPQVAVVLPSVAEAAPVTEPSQTSAPSPTPESASSQATESSDNTASSQTPLPPKAESRKPSRFFTLCRRLLALLIIAAVAALGYLMWEQDKTIARLERQQNDLLGQQDDMLAASSESTRSITLLEETLGSLQIALKQTQEALANQQDTVQALSDELVNTQLRLQDLNLDPQQERAWLLTEVEGMLRLAQQRLLAGQDVKTAIALLLAADEVLLNIDDSTVYPARDAIANDLAALRAVPEVDSQGIYLELSALVQRVGNLQLKTGNEEQLRMAEPVTLQGPGDGGWLDKIADKMGALVTVRRHDAPLQGMITAEQGYYVRQNIRLLLEQSQLALWRGQEEVYRNNLALALEYIDQYFLADDGEFRSIVAALENLRDEVISIQVPPANSGLVAVRQLLQSYE